MPNPFISGAPLNTQTHTYVYAAQPTPTLKLYPTRMKIVDLHVLFVCFCLVVTCSGSKLICFFVERICFPLRITCFYPYVSIANLLASSSLHVAFHRPFLSVALHVAFTTENGGRTQSETRISVADDGDTISYPSSKYAMAPPRCHPSGMSQEETYAVG